MTGEGGRCSVLDAPKASQFRIEITVKYFVVTMRFSMIHRFKRRRIYGGAFVWLTSGPYEGWRLTTVGCVNSDAKIDMLTCQCLSAYPSWRLYDSNGRRCLRLSAWWHHWYLTGMWCAGCANSRAVLCSNSNEFSTGLSIGGHGLGLEGSEIYLRYGIRTSVDSVTVY